MHEPNREFGLEFHCDYPYQHDYYFFGDSVALKQILLNIVGNAIKFTDSGFVKIHVDVVKHEAHPENCSLDFCIEDSGPGIVADKQSLIFDRFQQADTSITRKYGGAGLGLSIAKGIVDLLGGSIHLESVLHHGTKFFIKIPMRLAVNHMQPPRHVEEPLNNTVAMNPTQPCRARVLIVEDDEIIQMVYQSFLQQLNCHVSITASGMSALALLQQHEFDLILSDIGLPDISGIELAKEYQTLAKQHKAPIIAVTGYGDLQNHEELMTYGIAEIFVKPINKSILEELLHKYALKKNACFTAVASGI